MVWMSLDPVSIPWLSGRKVSWLVDAKLKRVRLISLGAPLPYSQLETMVIVGLAREVDKLSPRYFPDVSVQSALPLVAAFWALVSASIIFSVSALVAWISAARPYAVTPSVVRMVIIVTVTKSSIRV